jgi:tripartite-type tricarboxylate transporter receptor subunit TctC
VKCRIFMAAVIACTSHVAVAAWPEKPISIVVPFAAGGATDVTARVLGQHMATTLGQPVVVENVAGAGGTVGAGKVARASPDGYTLLMGSLGPQVAAVGLYAKLSYEPRKDFEPVIMAALTPMVVSVRKDLPVNDFRSFVQYLRQNGSKTNFASGGAGAQSHLLCLYLAQLTGSTPTHVPYRGSGPAMNALLAQEVDFTCDQAIGVLPHTKSGGIKPLAVARSTRISVMPNLPSAAEQGLPTFDADGWLALFAPKDTPKAVIDRINEAARLALKDEAVRKRMIDLGNEIPPDAQLTPTALGKLVDAETERWLPIIKKAGAKAE